MATESSAFSDKATGVSLDHDLRECICSGPLLSSCGFSVSQIDENAAKWIELGDVLIKSLGFPSKENLDAVQRMRVYQYYLPVFFWCLEQLKGHKQAHPEGRPLVLGMSAPQGCGKTTIVEELETLFKYAGIRAASVSIDDFYLGFEDQNALAEANPGNAVLKVRGNAGTHDLELGTRTLSALCSAVSPEVTVAVPRYDKSQHGGRGDRADPSTWPVVSGPLDVVLFEGWMLGFAAVTDQEAADVSPDLVSVNESLRGYQEAWDRFVDSWLVVRVLDPKCVYDWREQAEAVMRQSGKGGMSKDQVRDFVDRYMPAYKAYLPGLYSKGPTTARPGHVLTIAINERRGLAAEQPQQF